MTLVLYNTQVLYNAQIFIPKPDYFIGQGQQIQMQLDQTTKPTSFNATRPDHYAYSYGFRCQYFL